MIKIIGLGNRLRGDDGIGPAILDAVAEDDRFAGIAAIEVGSDAFSVMEHLMDCDQAVIIDCANIRRQPGETMRLPLDPNHLKSEKIGFSLHGFGLAEVLHLTAETGTLPKGSIIGIQPQNLAFNTGLSEPVEQQIPAILDLLFEEIQSYDKKNSNH
jgi:hydrogenase maturation protease